MEDPGTAVAGTEVTGTVQHEAWRRRVLPPVEEVRPGLWSLPVPIPHNPLRYVTAYALALAGGGLGLVDTGWESEEGWRALRDGLASIGAGVADVRGVLITHAHWDHIGLGARVAAASGAWVAIHPADLRAVHHFTGKPPEQVVAEEVAFLVALGADPAEAAADVGTPEHMAHLAGMVVPDRLLEHGDRADLPGWSLRAVHTPGHTAGHLCFAEERTGLFFSGDHVLPRISPNVSTSGFGAADPLGDFLASLEVAGSGAAAEVLPAHEWRFRGLAARTAELRAHHERRLAELLAAIRAHPHATPWQLAAHLTWSRPWEDYERRMRIFAVTETDAHLRLLARRGLVVGSGGPVPTWTVAAR
ncbi:MBL fold metallo-hydrolase [Geodermatophilus marinus]|uniref:MBL fold metallo-hydrolase n=1 Tax=Geodermatophilus sp. LHW52908 TaxID=2303986 RepID=UPI000E3C4764|nr:MBL fold metallo-hydrolase [Geodermatophilus sp. LHW52908]RFU19641.1 MBL fold metallo-hydrolase [Geodermatophilus sp. LHW52908]